MITKIILIQFLDNSYTKIFNKYWGGVNIKVNMIMDIFKVSDHPLLIALPSMGSDKHLLGRPVQTQGGATPPKWNWLPKKGWSQRQIGQAPPIEGGNKI